MKSCGGEAGSHLTELQQHFLEEPEPYRNAAPAAAVPALPELLVVVYVICTDDGTVLQKRKENIYAVYSKKQNNLYVKFI
jgi:hypothetical protein